MVDSPNPSTIDTAPVVSDAKITDADANGADGESTLSVSFTFNEAMDTDTDPTVSFAPDRSVHIDQSGVLGWTMARPTNSRQLLLMQVLMLMK